MLVCTSSLKKKVHSQEFQEFCLTLVCTGQHPVHARPGGGTCGHHLRVWNLEGGEALDQAQDEAREEREVALSSCVFHQAKA